MAPAFVIPERALEELEQEHGEDRLWVQHLLDVTESDAEELAKEVAFELGDNEVTCVEEQTLFDQLYSLIKSFASFQPSTKRILIETLCSNFAVIIASIASLKRSPGEDLDNDAVSFHQQMHSHRNALKIYSYFLQHIYISEEAATEPRKGKTRLPSSKSQQPRRTHVPLAWNWDDFRVRIVSLLGRALEADLQQVYGMAQPEEGLLAFFAKFGLKLLENQMLLRDKDAKEALCRYLAACAVKYDYHEQLVPSMIDLLHKCEHLAVPLADVVATSEKIYSDNKLAVGLLREIGITNPTEYSRVTSVAENVKLFLVELAERVPKLMAANLSMLMPHFGGESYKIRNALVTVLGKLIVRASGDADCNAGEEFRLRNKQGMLEVLIERTRDSNAFTRSCVLQTWVYLCEKHALSIGLWNQVVDIAAGRLYDKAVLVRKSALQLLTTLLEYNPFGPQLRTGIFEATLDKYKAQLQKITEESGNIDPSVNLSEGMVAEEPAGGNSFEETQESDPSHSQETSGVHPRSDIGGLEQTRALVASLESALHFSKAIASTMPVISQLLSSSAIFDVQHGIQYLTCCRKFSIDGSEECIRIMLPLVFSQEKSIYEAVEAAFVMTYIKRSPQETASNLLKLTVEASIGDLASIEAVLVSLMTKREIPAGTISALWDVFIFNAAGVTPEQCRGALSLLCMIAKASPTVLSPRIQNIVDIGFGRWAKEDILLARFACVALQRVPTEDKTKLQSGHKVFSILSSLIIGQRLSDRSWYSAAEQAISALYAIHPTPETFISNLMLKFSESIFTCNNTEEQATGGTDAAKDFEKGLSTASSTMLSRFLFAAGHVALKHLLYTESCVRAIRKQRRDQERAAADAAAAAEVAKENEAPKEENLTAELGLAASEDLKLDLLLEKAESEIISGSETTKFLIGKIAPVVAKLCRNSTILQQFPRLRSSAVLCLCKFMAIDATYCDENLQLLFTLAQNSTEESVRSNCIISLGDIAFRFPNLLEPWTEHIYARLHDKSTHVRKNAVLVIAHLILNDMMKVKGHISEMALRIQDEDARISDLAKLFFHELSKKGTSPIYNLLPDILSRLSSSPTLTRETFRSIMQFLIGLIKKDRQMEGLIEKLCNRFSGTSDRIQWQAIAYCLSQLTYAEKGMKKLVESFKQFQNALIDEQVVDHFKAICSKAKKLGKQEYRQFVEEFEENISSCHEQKREEDLAAEKAQTRCAGDESLTDIATEGKQDQESSTCCTGIEDEITSGEDDSTAQSRALVRDSKIRSTRKGIQKISEAPREPLDSAKERTCKKSESISEDTQSTCTEGSNLHKSEDSGDESGDPLSKNIPEKAVSEEASSCSSIEGDECSDSEREECSQMERSPLQEL